jgi:hypothetical protein
MSIIGLQQRRIWRRLLSCAVAYAFALHVALFGFAAARSTTLAGDQDALGFALCLHDDGSAPLAPDGNSGGDDHCKLCTAAAHKLFAPPSVPQRFVMRRVDKAPLLAGDWFIPSPIEHATPQPRGPPRTA